jgi:hypothetical protein
MVRVVTSSIDYSDYISFQGWWGLTVQLGDGGVTGARVRPKGRVEREEEKRRWLHALDDNILEMEECGQVASSTGSPVHKNPAPFQVFITCNG